MNTLPKSILVKSQNYESDWRTYKEKGETYRIRVCIRWDDSCNNKHNSFGITGETQWKNKRGVWVEDSFGCIHEEIQKHFPEYSHLIKWHLVTSEGPLWYKRNTLYHLGERDCWGLLKGEKKQILKGGVTPSWKIKAINKTTNEEINIYDLPQSYDSFTKPTLDYELVVVPWYRVGEGKPKDIKAALDAAIPFPKGHPLHINEEDLNLPEEDLLKLLDSRLIPMMLLFKQDIEALGFVY